MIARFMAKVNKTQSCWLWTGAKNHQGYGVFRIGPKMFRAHRASWFIFRGENPTLDVLHKCDMPECVNPDHLFLGTQQENMTDMYNKGRGPCRLGSKNGFAKLNEESVKEIKRRLDQGETQRPLAKEFGVSQSLIREIKLKRNWKHVTI